MAKAIFETVVTILLKEEKHMQVKRYRKFVFEDDKGIRFEAEASNGNFFEFSEGTSGELIGKACNQLSIVSNNVLSELPTVSDGEYAEVLSVYADYNGNQAVVPAGWTISGVSRENTIWGKDLGLVIYCIPKEKVYDIDWTNSDEVEILQETYDQLVWTPVSLLEANGTLDGNSFTEKFGRRNYQNEEFSESEYNEPFIGELVLEKESIDKYGGYYSTRYDISKDKETGKPRSTKGAEPWTNIDYPSMKEIASIMFESEAITSSHLMYGAEYDTREEWIIETKTKLLDEIAKDSTEWGNYKNRKGSPKEAVKTGSCEEWCANNIYDFTGNRDEWTQERRGSSCRVFRGGDFSDYGNDCPADYRCYDYPYMTYIGTGFRATVCIR